MFLQRKCRLLPSDGDTKRTWRNNGNGTGDSFYIDDIRLFTFTTSNAVNITDNETLTGDGGGLYAGGGNVTIGPADISGNTAATNGGGIFPRTATALSTAATSARTGHQLRHPWRWSLRSWRHYQHHRETSNTTRPRRTVAASMLMVARSSIAHPPPKAGYTRTTQTREAEASSSQARVTST